MQVLLNIQMAGRILDQKKEHLGGNSALHYAIYNQKNDFVKKMIDILIKNEQQDFLIAGHFIAKEAKNTEIIQMIENTGVLKDRFMLELLTDLILLYLQIQANIMK